MELRLPSDDASWPLEGIDALLMPTNFDVLDGEEAEEAGEWKELLLAVNRLLPVEADAVVVDVDEDEKSFWLRKSLEPN